MTEFLDLDEFESLKELVPEELDTMMIHLANKFKEMSQVTLSLSELYEESLVDSARELRDTMRNTALFIEKCEAIEGKLDGIHQLARQLSAMRRYVENLDKTINKVK